MKCPRFLALGLSALWVSFVLAGVTSPAAAQQAPPAPMTVSLRSTAAGASLAGPNCAISNNYLLYGAQYVNSAVVNGTWFVVTTVDCPGGNVPDMALYVALDLGSSRVASAVKGFTGVPRNVDGLYAWAPCAVCNGTYTLTWAQIIAAPAGFAFGTQQPAGCGAILSGAYLVCVAQKTVTI